MTHTTGHCTTRNVSTSTLNLMRCVLDALRKASRESGVAEVETPHAIYTAKRNGDTLRIFEGAQDGRLFRVATVTDTDRKDAIYQMVRWR